MLDDLKYFDLTPALITLLRASNVNDRLSECEYGAAEIDCKRPYGNGDVERDIARILGWPVDEDGDPRDPKTCRSIHELTPIALQVVLSAGSFEPGRYQVTRYGSRWTKVAPVPARMW